MIKTLDSQTVEITGTNLELSLQVKVRAEVEEHGKCFTGTFFADLIRRLPDGLITMNMSSDSYSVKLTGNQSKWSSAAWILLISTPQQCPWKKAVCSTKYPQTSHRKVSYAISQDEAAGYDRNAS